MESKLESKVLYLFVEHFSNASRECFFEKELPFLETEFDKVYVIPLYPDHSILSYHSDKVVVLNFDYFQACNRVKVLFYNFILVFRIFFFEILKTHDRLFYLRNFRSLLNSILITISATTKLESLISKTINEYTIFYSYWFNQWMRSFSILKLKYPKLKIVSRVHGGDYDEDQVKKTLSFRYFQLRQVNKIFPVSDFGKNYLIKTFKVNPALIKTSRLGLSHYSQLSQFKQDKLRIVSCSSLIPLKRISLIIETLQHIDIPYEWIHFGDGPLKTELQKLTTSLTGEVKWMGHVDNDTFIDFLKKEAVSLFINTSESEGIPVSMMEAISFGIPLMGTNVGGVSEIVTKSTGWLLSKNFSPIEVAQIIKTLHLSGDLYNETFRAGVQTFYKNYFSADINHKDFALQLASIK